MAAGAHDILLQAEYTLTSIPPSVSWPAQDKTKAKTIVRCNQPKDAQQGIQQVKILLRTLGILVWMLCTCVACYA